MEPEQQLLIPDAIESPVQRDSLGRPAQVPNTGEGRPRGARGRRNHVLEHIARQHQIPLMERLVQDALAGNTEAAKIIFDRIWPKPRIAPLQLGVSKTATPADVRDAMHEILSSVVNGEIPADAGAAVVAMMKDILAAHAIETLNGTAARAETDALQLLKDRVARVIAERDRRALEPLAAEPAA